MSVVAWILVAIVAGIVADHVSHCEGFTVDLCLSLIGGVIGGVFYSHFGARAASTGLDPYSVLAASFGAVSALFVYRLLANSARHRWGGHHHQG
jgi:uncharacterized membrane protein YeaQ/YmgE (transglycosylase-associated protein family)